MKNLNKKYKFLLGILVFVLVSNNTGKGGAFIQGSYLLKFFSLKGAPK